MLHDSYDSQRSSDPRRLEDQLAELRSELLIFRSPVPRWLAPAVVVALSLVALLVGVLIVLVIFLILEVKSLESEVSLYQTWAITHRHEGGQQPNRENLPLPKEP